MIDEIRFSYEFLGHTLEHLSDVYDVPLDLLSTTATAQKWVRGTDLPTLPTASTEAELEIYTKAVTDRLRQVAIGRQIMLYPKYVRLEDTLIKKMQDMASNLASNEINVERKLASLVNSLKSLREHEPIKVTGGDDDGSGKPTVVVNIQNNVD